MRRVWRGIAIFLLGGLLGTALGIALGFFFFPYVFPPPPAFEQLTQAQRRDAPAIPHRVRSMQRRVVPNDLRSEGREQLRH